MDTLFWKQLHPNIKVEHTKHLLYGKYPYRLVLKCVGTSMLRHPDASFEEQAEWKRNVNYGGSWKPKLIRRPEPYEFALLHRLRDIRAELLEQDNDSIKTRIEDPLMQFYTVDEKLLQDLANKMFTGLDAANYIQSITMPGSAEDLKLLHQGFVLKNNSDYPFRINLRDGRYAESTRESLLKYLDSIGDDVSVPQNTRRQLERARGDFVWGGYFYCADENIRIMISMIHPRLIRSVDRYYSQDK